MVVLHIACIKNNLFNGVCVAVPMHVKNQGQYADTALLNVNSIKIDSVGKQLEYFDDFDINSIPEPFNKPDIVIFHEAYRIEYLKIAKSLYKNKVPYGIIPHGELRSEAQKKKWLKKKTANILMFNKFINRAKFIQCLSELELKNTHFGKYKFVSTNGIDIPEIKKENFTKKGINIVFIGRLEAKVKGIDLLIEAVKEKKDFLKSNNVKIEIYGPDFKGRYENVMNLIKKNDVEDIVSLNYEIIGKAKENKLLETDVFVQTSRHEGMPMGILEAMSYGVPCAVTKGTNLGDFIVKNNCGWCSETSVPGIAEMLEKLIFENDALKEKSENARKAVSEHFSWDVISKNAVKTYKRLLK